MQLWTTLARPSVLNPSALRVLLALELRHRNHSVARQVLFLRKPNGVLKQRGHLKGRAKPPQEEQKAGRSGLFERGFRAKLFERDAVGIVDLSLKRLNLEHSPKFDGEALKDEDVSDFKEHVRKSLTTPVSRRSLEANSFCISLQRSYLRDGQKGIAATLWVALGDHTRTRRISPEDLENQKRVLDLRYPAEWFPKPRMLQRTIHLHIGPTNSGKTYQALKRLEQAKSGVYAGPLRLLAYEVYNRMIAKGKVCGLITGDDIRIPEGERMEIQSCTVEMVPLAGAESEVAVIDEIQLMADPQRGWAWTQALLGIIAKEVHLCGEPRVVPLIRELAATMGDKLEIHEYKRLSPLTVMQTSLHGNLRNLQKGDCLVTFSRKQIHALKKEVEIVTGKRCAIVYGSLPPDTRAQQADLFNDPNNDYDYLVASDAIGMGLNLEIKRVIFETTFKHDNITYGRVSVAQMKQIAGRAGRYRTAAQDLRDATTQSVHGYKATQTSSSENVGYVTTLHDLDLPYLQEAMLTEPPPLIAAGVQPETELVARFASYFPPSTPFRYVLKRLYDMSTIHDRYFFVNIEDQGRIADALEDIKNLTTIDRYIFSLCPTNMKDGESSAVIRELATCVATQSGGGFLELKTIDLALLDQPLSGDREYIQKLESLHRSIGLYLWLSFRFRGVFINHAMAMHAKTLVEKQIERALTEFSASRKVRERLRRDSRKMNEEWLKAVKHEDALALSEEDMRIPGSGEASEDGSLARLTKFDAGLEFGNGEDSTNGRIVQDDIVNRDGDARMGDAKLSAGMNT